MKFYGFFGSSNCCLVKERSWSHLCFSGQHHENIFQALHKNFNRHSLPLSTKINEKTILVCAIIDNKVAGSGTLAKSDRN